LLEVLGAASAAEMVGMVPKFDLEVVFILFSLDSVLFSLAIQINKTIWLIIGFLPMSFNFIFLMPLIHNGDS
jgi:hypothetical protein